MNMSRLYNIFPENKIIFLDGATGTELIKRGLKQGESPELWCLANPLLIKEVEERYLASGSDIIYVPSFGANRLKLSEFKSENQVAEINQKLAANVVKILENNALAFGDLSPTGSFLEPFGDLNFFELINIYQEQVKGLIAGGVQGFVIETMLDLQEARAAVLAIREISDLPIMVSMTFDENQRTLSGNSPLCCLLALQELDIDAFGCNCSTGPANMVEIIKSLKPYARIPLLAKPNAGLPQLINNQTVFSLEAKDFANEVCALADAGANIIGGCCGTTPEHIREVVQLLQERTIESITPQIKLDTLFSSSRNVVNLSELSESDIGKSLDFATNSKLGAAILANDSSPMIDSAFDDVADGCQLLIVNLLGTQIEENHSALEFLIRELTSNIALPIIFKSELSDAQKFIKKLYCGK